MFGQNPPNNRGNFNTSQVGKYHPGNFNRYNNPKGNNGNNQFTISINKIIYVISFQNNMMSIFKKNLR